jgi:hypothetical protein
MQQDWVQVARVSPRLNRPADPRLGHTRLGSKPTRSPSIAVVWRDALLAFSTHAGPILFIALVGFAGVALITDHLRAAASPGLCRNLPGGLCSGVVALFLLGVAQAGAATLAQGLIAAVLVQPHAGWSAAFRLCPAWLAGCLVYSVLLTAGQPVTSASAQALQMHLDANAQASDALLNDHELRHASRALLMTTLQSLLPAAPLPLAGILGWAEPASQQPARPAVCSNLSLDAVRMNLGRMAEYMSAYCQNAAPPLNGVVAMLMVALILVTETLLRFRVVAALCPRGIGAPSGLLSPLFHSAHVGWRHFLFVTAHIWALRLILLTVQVLFCALPMLILQRNIVPAVPSYLPGLAWLVPTLAGVSSAGMALVSGVCAAFSTVYDARLFLAIKQASGSNAMRPLEGQKIDASSRVSPR